MDSGILAEAFEKGPLREGRAVGWGVSHRNINVRTPRKEMCGKWSVACCHDPSGTLAGPTAKSGMVKNKEIKREKNLHGVINMGWITSGVGDPVQPVEALENSSELKPQRLQSPTTRTKIIHMHHKLMLCQMRAYLHPIFVFPLLRTLLVYSLPVCDQYWQVYATDKFDVQHRFITEFEHK